LCKVGEENELEHEDSESKHSCDNDGFFERQLLGHHQFTFVPILFKLVIMFGGFGS